MIVKKIRKILIYLLFSLIIITSFSCCPRNHMIDGGKKMTSWQPKIVHYLPTADPVLEYWNGRRKEEEIKRREGNFPAPFLTLA